MCHECVPGYYGSSCEHKCTKCEECDQTGKCQKGCPPGTYGETCQLDCPKECLFENCDTVTGKCQYCKKGFYGEYCDKDCGKCTGNCDSAGDCPTNCSIGSYGKRCNQLCPKECFLGDCTKDGKCKACNKGFFGDDCTNSCQFEFCDENGKEKKGCSPTTYGPECKSNCSFSCVNRHCNHLTGNCHQCVEGYYGITCEHKCQKCEVCDRRGTCTSGCYPGLYGDECDKPCEGDCLNGNCDIKTGACLECPEGFYGDDCKKKCSINTACDIKTGDTIPDDCEDGKFGQYCTETCPENCLDGKCSKTTGSCSDCSPGLFGLKCDKQCGNCVNSCDKNGTCLKPPGENIDSIKDLSVCIFGYYGALCEDKCSKDCLGGDCDEKGHCRGCKPGYYGIDCSLKCKKRDCDMEGEPVPYCVDHYYGENCDIWCSRACVDRNCTSSGACLSCFKGFYGLYCNKTCTGCDECDADGKCKKCDYGLYGSRCELKCSKKCFAHNCESSVGICLECPDGFYGDDCSKKCSPSDDTVAKCDKDGNEIVTDCVLNHYGEGCSEKCPESCHGGLCRYAGSCDMCLQGFYGDKCDLECDNCNICDRGGTCIEVTRYDPITNTTINIPRCANGLTGLKCEKECSSNCLASNCDDEGKCRECKDGTYGEDCENFCDAFCDIEGNPIPTENKCYRGSYGQNCQYTCSSNCVEGDCMSATGTCQACPKDRFGQFCEKKCHGTTACDRTGRKTEKCFPGLFGDRCEKKCSPKCHHGNCDADGLCLECPNGFYGADCESVCKYPVCDISTGEEKKDCASGTFGRNCEWSCSRNCKGRTCSVTTGSCNSCFQGYFGLWCTMRCPNCANCDRQGMCISECFPGFTGKNCDKGCPENCYSKVCGKNGGCVECAVGFYGPLCSSTCPENKLCDINGRLIEPCEGFIFGENCTDPCNRTCVKGCSHIRGICLECTKETYGRFCDLKCRNCKNGCNRQGVCEKLDESHEKESRFSGFFIVAILIVALTLGVLGLIAFKNRSKRDSIISNETEEALVYLDEPTKLPKQTGSSNADFKQIPDDAEDEDDESEDEDDNEYEEVEENNNFQPVKSSPHSQMR